jgi:hypothetical protein
LVSPRLGHQHQHIAGAIATAVVASVDALDDLPSIVKDGQRVGKAIWKLTRDLQRVPALPY